MANPIRCYAAAVAFATAPFVVAACGSIISLNDGPDASMNPASGGATSATPETGGAASQLPGESGGQGATNPGTGGATLGQALPSPYPCTSATTAHYDDPPILQPNAGCRDIYNSSQSYPPGTIRTIVAPTAPAGASCVAINCQCGADLNWQPQTATMCW